MSTRAAIVAGALLVSAWLQPPAQAAFPGANGLIAFARESPQRGIFTIDPSGEELTRLTHGQDYRPRWSPDGTRIVFQRFVGVHSDIYVMDADGSNVERLTQRGGFQPDWSPDSNRIVFGNGLGHRQEIFVDERGRDRCD